MKYLLEVYVEATVATHDGTAERRRRNINKEFSHLRICLRKKLVGIRCTCLEGC